MFSKLASKVWVMQLLCRWKDGRRRRTSFKKGNKFEASNIWNVYKIIKDKAGRISLKNILSNNMFSLKMLNILLSCECGIAVFLGFFFNKKTCLLILANHVLSSFSYSILINRKRKNVMSLGLWSIYLGGLSRPGCIEQTCQSE